MSKKWYTALAATVAICAIVTPAAEAASYTVQKGDTLTKIAKQHEVSVEQLKTWNKLQSDMILINQKLTVTSPEASLHKEEKAVTVTHSVKKGETIAQIAKAYNMTAAQLKELNNLQTDVIYANQKLVITATPSANKQIAKNEKAIKVNPTTNGQAIYQKTIELAQELIGTPYVFAGNTIEGFDCSGFVKYVYVNAGLDIARKSSLDYFLQDTTAVEKPVPGDLLFFENTYIPTISHMGIYIGEDQFIHAGSKGVEISNVTHSYWAERFVAYKRFNLIQ